MLRRSPRSVVAAAAALLLAVLSLAACGAPEEHVEEPLREGLNIPLAGLTYNVFITRQLNLRDPEDRDYYRGPEAPPNKAHYAIFLQACNDGDGPAEAAREFKILDSQGAEFSPLPLEKDNIFAYRPISLPPQECIPNRLSTAAQAPAGGAVLMFLLPLAATENRPLELEIEPPSGRGEPARVELDI
jgi:hypothetical protein